MIYSNELDKIVDKILQNAVLTKKSLFSIQKIFTNKMVIF